MKRKWTLLLAVLLLAAGVGAERYSAMSARKLAERKNDLRRELEGLKDRTAKAEGERARYQRVSDLAKRLQGTVAWEPDSTNALRWFADLAAELNARLVSSRLLVPSKPEEATALETFDRVSYALELEGNYGALVRYVDRVERSPHVMLIESLSLTADRSDDGTGQMRLQVTCLYPKPQQAVSVAEKPR